MVMTDPIADMLTRIRNANSAYHEKVEMPASKVKAAVLEILKEEGFVKNFETVNEGKTLKVTATNSQNIIALDGLASLFSSACCRRTSLSKGLLFHGYPPSSYTTYLAKKSPIFSKASCL